jgi:predicted HD phosphohydrolase
VSGAGADLSVDEIVAVLAAGADRPLGPSVGVTQLDHALQTAALLAHEHPGDDELAAAGLVHDIGQWLPGGTDQNHARDAARAVRRALGDRVAAVVGLHVEAKRYLVASDAAYGRVLTTDSVLSLGHQGGAMSSDEVAEFLRLPWAPDAVTLRKADDRAKVDGLAVTELSAWVAVLRRVAGTDGAAPA